MVDRWLHAEPVTNPNLHQAVADFQALLYSVDGLDYGALLGEYREAELWDKVAITLLKLGRIGEAITIAKRHLTATDEIAIFAADLAQSDDGKHLDRAITLMEDHAWEIDGRNAAADAEAEAWLTFHYTLAGQAAKALPLAGKWFARSPGLEAWRCVRDAAQLPGQPKDVWTSRRQAMEATLIAAGEWWDLVLIRADDLRIEEALEAFHQVEHQANLDPLLYTEDELYSLAITIGQAREQADPDAAMALYLQLANDFIKQRNRGAYQQAAQSLGRVRYVLELHGRGAEWPDLVRKIREEHRTLRAFHEELAAFDL